MNTKLFLLYQTEAVEEGRPVCTRASDSSTVRMGDCQAAAKYTQGSDSGSSSALSEQRFRFSDKRGFCSLKSQKRKCL